METMLRRKLQIYVISLYEKDSSTVITSKEN